jgi:hypothetical protein
VLNSISLHSAPPDFLLRVVALIKFVRLSLRKKQDAQGLKPNVFSILYGPTKVVP